MKSRLNVVKICLGIGIAGLVLPILTGSLYGLPSTDDFNNAIGWINNNDRSHLKYLFDNMVKVYQRWQGTYFGDFLAGFPVFYEYGFVGLRIWMFFIAALFFVSYILALKELCSLIQMETNKQIGICLILYVGLIYLLGTNSLEEVFYWFTATCTYTLPICLTLLCVYNYMAYISYYKILNLIFAIIFAFGAAGGALDVAALLCSLLFFGICYRLVIKRKIGKEIFIGAVALSGTLINVFAPGNYVRHAVIDSEIRVLNSIRDTFKRVTSIISTDFRTGLLLLIIVSVFLYGYKHLKQSKFEFKLPGAVTLYAFMSVFITDFPVVLGYSGRGVPPRCAFVEHLAVTIYLIIVSLYWAGWCSKKELFEFERAILLVLALVCAIPLSVYCNFDMFISLTPYNMAYHIINGDFNAIAKREESVIAQIEESMDDDVVVYKESDAPDEWSNLKRIGLLEDSEEYINTILANYYGKNSISIKYMTQK